MKKDDGGPAYPAEIGANHKKGMSLRMKIAIEAMKGILSNSSVGTFKPEHGERFICVC